jgi:hypothetical protein
MAKKHESKWNIEDLTDPDIYDAIRYLDPLPRSANERCSTSEDEQHGDRGVLICVGFIILLFGCLAFMLLYWR